MIHPIFLYGDPVLQAKSNNIDLISAAPDEIKELVDDMFETMHRANGIGLAAPQIGVMTRLFVVEAHDKVEKFDIRETFINPLITKFSDKTCHMTEGCLSIPDVPALVQRPESISITYYNYELEKVVKEYDGMAARIIQHEYDHLNGVLFIDNLPQMWNVIIQPALEKITNRQITTRYHSK
jgi:peptide deformylase